MKEESYNPVKSFVHSVGDAAERIVTGQQLIASHEKAVSRLKVCEGCGHLNKIRECKICLCFVDAKVYLEGEACPKKLW